MRALEDFFFGPADVRPLNWFRLFFCIFTLLNLVHFFLDRGILFGPSGVLSIEAARQIIPAMNWFPQFLLSDAMVSIAMTVGFLSTVTLALGRYPRVSAAILLFVIVQLQLRNPLAMRGADELTRILLVYFIVTPSRYFLSLRQLIAGGTGAIELPAWPIRIFQLQLVSLYFVAGVMKLKGEAWRSGSAVYYSLANWDLSWVPEWADDVPWPVIQIATYSTLAFELFFGVLLLWTLTRKWALYFGVALHLGMATFLNVAGWHGLMLSYFILFFSFPYLSRPRTL